MGRHKDADWNLPTDPKGCIASWEHVNRALLMDIRDELKRLNALLHCSNFVGIPATLKTIQRHTTNLPKAPPKRRA